jgi:hypothetical protein
MPLYHFHVHNDVVATDDEGVEYADLEAAKAAAVENARHLMSDEVRYKGRLSLGHSIEIADPLGASLHVTRYGDCVTIRP